MKRTRVIRVGPKGSEQLGSVDVRLLITVKQLALRYGIAERTAHLWKEARRVSHYKIGRSVRFHPGETDEEIKVFRIPAQVSKY